MKRERGNQLYVAGGAILALVLIIAAAAWYVGAERKKAYAAGELAERARWQGRLNEELRMANAAFAAARARAEQLEREAAQDLVALDEEYQKEIRDVEARKDRFVSDVVAGRIRLYDPCRAAAGEPAGRPAEGAAAAAAGERDGDADLRRAYEERVARSIGIAREADAALTLAQGTIRTYLKTCRAASP